ncbi:hypothetical protein L195_g007713 [Trifolium pratense]|uniref:Uncharacterized protein n=1 Tax=Trifolium pratense TaxID=57577 RepID=A0A2K3P750_TRIPR|nr:hypothetical protein L195_g007713 [Trifolium pratense]
MSAHLQTLYLKKSYTENSFFLSGWSSVVFPSCDSSSINSVHETAESVVFRRSTFVNGILKMFEHPHQLLLESRTYDWESNWGHDKFPFMANASVVLSFNALRHLPWPL